MIRDLELANEPVPRQRACAVCGERERLTLLLRQRFEMPTRGAVHGGYDVVVCDRCGFGFASSPPSQAYLDHYYDEMAKRTEMLDASSAFEETAATVRRNRSSFDDVRGFVKPGDRILEVGCYTGYLLKHIRQEMPDVELVGLEPSSFAAGIAKEHYELDVRVGSLFDDLDLGTFDVIIVLHVLEHIVDLQRFLGKLRLLLRPGGRLHVEVPNAALFSLNQDLPEARQGQRMEPYLEFNFEHVNYFTPTSLRNVLERHGYSTLSVEARQSTLPVIAATSSLPEIPFAADTRDALGAYVRECREAMQPALAAIRELLARQSEIIVWGAGPHTQRLIGSGELAAERVRFFVDSNPSFAGGTLGGRPVLAPSEVREHPELPILISSFRFEEEIAAEIGAAGYPNEIVTMYARRACLT